MKVGKEYPIYRELGNHYNTYGQYIPITVREPALGKVLKVLNPSCGASCIMKVGDHELLIKEKELKLPWVKTLKRT